MIYLKNIDKIVLCRYKGFSLTLVSTTPQELPLDLHLNEGGLWLIIFCFVSVIGYVEQLSSWFFMLNEIASKFCECMCLVCVCVCTV